MNAQKLALIGLVVVLLGFYNGAQPDLLRMRTMSISPEQNPQKVRQLRKEQYGPSLEWLDRVMAASAQSGPTDEWTPKLDARVLSSLMVAGLASGFKSQVANLLWMKSDEYWHKGMTTRQNPLMEMVVTLDPQFIEAWSTAGWHWAYNIYADVPMNPAIKDIKPDSEREKTIRQKQDKAILTGLDYLGRGANMNPDTYRLWFEWGWTREKKAGLLDEETIKLYRIAHSKPDVTEYSKMVNGAEVKAKGGMDVVGHTIGHIYEQIPDIDKALEVWGREQLKASPQELSLLRTVGEYWRRYGSDYSVIAQMYTGGDAVLKSRIKQLVPDVERLIAAQKVREKLQVRESTPTGAYVTICARYLQVWELRKQGKYDQAVKTLIGVMNADARYHLTALPTLGKVLELRGDAPEATQKQMKKLRDIEKDSAQDIGLALLARLYEDLEETSRDPKQKSVYRRLAYETWYRSKERNTLDFYALHRVRDYEDKYGLTPPQKIIDEIKKSRQGGSVEAAPQAPPNVQQYYKEHDDESDHANENA